MSRIKSRKKCVRCDKEFLLSEFYTCLTGKDGYRASCKECVRKVNRAWQEKNKQAHIQMRKDWVAKNSEKVSVSHCLKMREQRKKCPEKAAARWAVLKAIQKGKMEKLKWCQCCGKAAGEKKVEAHHASYEKKHWLDVVWLCPQHHREIHEWANGK